MRLFDVNIILHAHRVDAPHHDRMKDFVESCLGGDDVIGYTPLALSGFLRVVTHPKIFNPPTNIDIALEFCDSITATPGIVSVTPSDSHRTIFRHLIRASGASGNPVYYFCGVIFF